MLQVRVPNTHSVEREYVCRYVFEQRLGITVNLVFDEGVTDTRISHPDGGVVVIPDCLFAVPEANWLKSGCMASVRQLRSELGRFGLSDQLTALFGGSTDLAEQRLAQDYLLVDFDPLGGIFFLLSGMEEVIDDRRDEHGRFPAELGLIAREGLGDRPLVDEAIAYLAACLEALWPGMCRPQADFRVCPSHDLDHPFLYHGLSSGAIVRRVLRKLTGDVLVRQSIGAAGETLAQFFNYLAAGAAEDPYFAIDMLMDASEVRGLTSCFYVIVNARSDMDGMPYIDDPIIHRGLQRIAARGHRLGLHASYDCYNDTVRARHEVTVFRDLLERLGIVQDVLGVRQHYLRWAGPQHWRMWDDAGMDYDASVGYADRVGFRCGTSHSFPTFDLFARKALRIEERPLVVMDVAISPLTEREWRKREHSFLVTVEAIANACHAFGGHFELLWHNTQVQSRTQRRVYNRVLDNACGSQRVCCRTSDSVFTGRTDGRCAAPRSSQQRLP